MAQLSTKLPPPPGPLKRDQPGLEARPAAKRPRLHEACHADAATGGYWGQPDFGSVPCPWSLMALPSVATPPPARGSKRRLSTDTVAGPPQPTIATGSYKRARFREPSVDGPSGHGHPWHILCDDYRDPVNHDVSDDGDALMHSGRSQATGTGTSHVPNDSWRPTGHDYHDTTTSGADRASSAGTDPSSGR